MSWIGRSTLAQNKKQRKAERYNKMAVRVGSHPLIEIDDKSPWDEMYDGAPYYFTETTSKQWQKLIGGMLRDSEATPDTPSLCVNDFHYVFCYGTLKRGFGNSFMMRDSEYLGKAWTKLKCFVMVQNGVPAVLIDSGKEGKAVQGDIYRVSVPQLKELDIFESNGSLYKRRRVIVEHESGETIKAWMYFGVASVFDKNTCPKVASYTRKKNKVPYYTFQTKTKKVTH